jgi:hypothetical protein
VDRDDEVDALLASVARSPDDESAAASAEARSRRGWLRQQRAESSTMAGVLLTLAERDAPVSLRSGPWTHRGHLRSVTAVLATLEVPGGLALLPIGTISVVEAPTPVADDRQPGPGPDLAAVLAGLVPERPPVRLLLADGTHLAGVLVDVGQDIAYLRLPSSVATVRLAALAGCVLETGEGGD